MGNRFDLRTILIESAEICMFWPSQPVPSCLISHLVHSFPLSKPLMPLPWAAVTLLLFHAPLPIFLFPNWVGKMCVLVGPINLHFHGACSHSPSIPGLNPKTFICSNFLSSVLTYIDGAVLEVMIDLFQRITWTQQDLCRQITLKKNTNSGVNYVKFIFVLSACLYCLCCHYSTSDYSLWANKKWYQQRRDSASWPPGLCSQALGLGEEVNFLAQFSQYESPAWEQGPVVSD